MLKGRTSRDTKVSEILSRPAITVNRKTPISDCMILMSQKRIRHLPVLEDDQLLGLISMGDIVNWVMDSQKFTITQLQGYISGDYPG